MTRWLVPMLVSCLLASAFASVLAGSVWLTPREAFQALEFAQGCGGLARKLQPYVVQLPRQGFDALHKAGAVIPVAPEKWGTQFMALANKDLYDKKFGLHWDNPTFLEISSLVI